MQFRDNQLTNVVLDTLINMSSLKNVLRHNVLQRFGIDVNLQRQKLLLSSGAKLTSLLKTRTGPWSTLCLGVTFFNLDIFTGNSVTTPVNWLSLSCRSYILLHCDKSRIGPWNLFDHMTPSPDIANLTDLKNLYLKWK